jgi:hypothetical protein
MKRIKVFLVLTVVSLVYGTWPISSFSRMSVIFRNTLFAAGSNNILPVASKLDDYDECFSLYKDEAVYCMTKSLINLEPN